MERSYRPAQKRSWTCLRRWKLVEQTCRCVVLWRKRGNCFIRAVPTRVENRKCIKSRIAATIEWWGQASNQKRWRQEIEFLERDCCKSLKHVWWARSQAHPFINKFHERRSEADGEDVIIRRRSIATRERSDWLMNSDRQNWSLPSLLYTSARSVGNKLDDLYVLIHELSPPFICVTESWLDKTSDG